jgi:hypothetical protein
MATHLFAFNPKLWNWPSLADDIRTLARRGHFDTEWSCGRFRAIEPGSRAFMIRLGVPPKGIIGAGVVMTAPAEREHWIEAKRERGALARSVVLRSTGCTRRRSSRSTSSRRRRGGASAGACARPARACRPRSRRARAVVGRSRRARERAARPRRAGRAVDDRRRSTTSCATTTRRSRTSAARTRSASPAACRRSRTCTGSRCPPRATLSVLEIGCGDGSNLIPLAEAHPEGRFVGVDQSARLCASAREMAGALGSATRA